MRAQESESGSITDQMELDQLLQNILEETEEALSSYDKETKEKQGKELLDRKKTQQKFTRKHWNPWDKCKNGMWKKKMIAN